MTWRTPRLRRDVGRLCRLGPRAVFELLAELGREHLIRVHVEQRVAQFARRDPAALRALEGEP
jgi:hypothetical protein